MNALADYANHIYSEFLLFDWALFCQISVCKRFFFTRRLFVVVAVVVCLFVVAVVVCLFFCFFNWDKLDYKFFPGLSKIFQFQIKC